MYAGVGLILLFVVLMLVMGFIKAAFCRLTCLIYMSMTSVWPPNACRVGCCVGNIIINHLMYADDLVILAPSVAGLSKLLSICGIFGESNDIIFNQKKSASLYLISKMLKGAHLPNVYLSGVLVRQVDSVKYLGHFLTCELSDDIDIRQQCRV